MSSCRHNFVVKKTQYANLQVKEAANKAQAFCQGYLSFPQVNGKGSYMFYRAVFFAANDSGVINAC